jgi:acyl carrier protein
MSIELQVITIVQAVLGLPTTAPPLTRQSRLLGAVTALDSLAVVNILGQLEHTFGFLVDDTALSAAVFADVDALCRYVEAKLGA